MARVSKEKQKETLNKMRETRADDYLFLREILSEKLAWSNEQLKKGKEAITVHEDKVKELKEQVLRLEGSIIMINDVLSRAPKNGNNNDNAPD